MLPDSLYIRSYTKACLTRGSLIMLEFSKKSETHYDSQVSIPARFLWPGAGTDFFAGSRRSPRASTMLLPSASSFYGSA